MQSFIDAGQPLSPSSFFNFDGAMEGARSGSDDGVDLFKYYMDLQAFQGKDTQQQPYADASNNGDLMNSNSTSMLSPYNAFYNPSHYANAAIAPSSTLGASASQPSHSISQQPVDPSGNPPSGSNSSSLFPFAEASSSTALSNPSSAFNAVNPSSILSFDHLAGSENPQPIDPHLLMTRTSSGSDSTPSNSSILLPTVKEEDIEPASTFPLSNPAFPLSNLALATASANHQAQRRSASAAAPPSTKRRGASSALQDDSMNGIDGLSDDNQSDSDEDDHDEEDDLEVQAPKKRSSATAANKKRTSAATKASSTSKRVSTAQSKKESSVSHHAQTHPHALVPVPEWEDKLSKAEYDKLSSKEKRQMRNKISARNFRHRRKAHIDTLEALVADKDQVIAVLNEEVSTLRTENQGLRADIDILKKNWESIAAKIGASSAAPSTSSAPAHQLTPDEDDLYGAPGSLPALSPAASSSAESTNGDHLSELSFEQARGLVNSGAQAQASQARPSTSSSNGRRTTRSSIQRPNLRKDLGPSGANFSAFGMGGNRSMNVHTTFIPELNFNFPVPPASMLSSFSSPPASNTTLPALSDATSTSSGRTSPTLPFNNNNSNGNNASIADMLAGKRERDANANARLNMNPALNGLTQEQINNLREQFFSANSGMISSTPARPSSPSSASSGEDVTANISGKITRHGNGGLDPLQNSFFDANPFISLRQDSLQDYRAQLYAKLANNVAGIHQAQQQQHQSHQQQQQQGGMNGLRPAFFSQQPVNTTRRQESANVEEVAKIASIAQKTLFDKLSTAFWDAFAGNNTPATTRSMVPSDSSSSSAARKSAQQTRRGSNDDGQQVADLLAGRSRLRIVRSDDQTEAMVEDKMDSLAKQVEKLGLKK